MGRMRDLLVGFAEIDYTPGPGLAIAGQHYLRIGEGTHDPLMANAVALRQDDETVVMVSLDLCLLEPSYTAAVQQRFQERTGLPAERLLIHTTHSHVAPVAIPRFRGDPDPQFMATLEESILRSAELAITNLQPVTAYSGIGQLDHLNWNRRCMYADGSSITHGSADKEGFLGEEPARDHVVDAPLVPLLEWVRAAADHRNVELVGAFDQGIANLRQLPQHFAARMANAGRNLDHAARHLGYHAARKRVLFHQAQHVLSVGRQVVIVGVDELQFQLDPQGERLGMVEGFKTHGCLRRFCAS